VVWVTEALATLVNSQSGISFNSKSNGRLDIVKQVRVDLKETYNMGKFADPDYKHNEPETIRKRWEELLAFTKEFYQVEQKVLALFALAFDVYQSTNISDTISCPTIISPSSTLQRRIYSDLRNIRRLQISLLLIPTWVRECTVISEVSLFRTPHSCDSALIIGFKTMLAASRS